MGSIIPLALFYEPKALIKRVQLYPDFVLSSFSENSMRNLQLRNKVGIESPVIPGPFSQSFRQPVRSQPVNL